MFLLHHQTDFFVLMMEAIRLSETWVLKRATRLNIPEDVILHNRCLKNLRSFERMISSRWKNYLSQLLNVPNISNVGQTEVHTAKPLAPGPSSLGVEISIVMLKRHKSPGCDQFPAERILAEDEVLVCVRSTN
jgi:hypothetical protein